MMTRWGDDAVDDSAYNDPEPDDDLDDDAEWLNGPNRFDEDFREIVLRVRIGREIEVVARL